jgi:hypothetical protein
MTSHACGVPKMAYVWWHFGGNLFGLRREGGLGVGKLDMCPLISFFGTSDVDHMDVVQ